MVGLSQEDIDELMGNISHEEKNEEKEKTQVFGGKIFSSLPKKNIRFEYPYHSSVIKKENVIYNPKSTEIKKQEENLFEYTPNSKVIVRSIKNYIEYNTKTF